MYVPYVNFTIGFPRYRWIYVDYSRSRCTSLTNRSNEEMYIGFNGDTITLY